MVASRAATASSPTPPRAGRTPWPELTPMTLAPDQLPRSMIIVADAELLEREEELTRPHLLADAREGRGGITVVEARRSRLPCARRNAPRRPDAAPARGRCRARARFPSGSCASCPPGVAVRGRRSVAAAAPTEVLNAVLRPALTTDVLPIRLHGPPWLAGRLPHASRGDSSTMLAGPTPEPEALAILPAASRICRSR